MRIAFVVIAFLSIVCAINWPVWFPTMPKVNTDGVSGAFTGPVRMSQANPVTVTSSAPVIPFTMQWSDSNTGFYTAATLSVTDGRVRYVIAGKDTDRETFYRWLDAYLLKTAEGHQP